MRRFGILCLALTLGPPALSQPPAEWRPNIAEDNKAATWADTVEFLRNSINNPSITTVKYVVSSGSSGLAYGGATSDEECTLGYEGAYFDSNGPLLRHSRHKINLRLIDPLTVKVILPNNGVAPSQYRISLEGSKEAVFARVKAWQYGGDRKYKYSSAQETLNLVCDASDSKCQVTDVGVARLQVSFNDQEAAKRFSRAMMHTALLCGGTKAISPF
jgi:hypothetical protein